MNRKSFFQKKIQEFEDDLYLPLNQLAVNKTEKEISDCTDALNFILARAKCPIEFRGFIDAVIGAADGISEKFKASDLDIGKRMLGSLSEGVTPGAIKKRVQRVRKQFTEWQQQENYCFIEISKGGQAPDGSRYKTEYSVPLLKAAAEALDKARQAHDWSINAQGAIKQAARSALIKLDGKPVKHDRFNRPRRDTESDLNRNLKTAATLILKSYRTIEANGGDGNKALHILGSKLEECIPSFKWDDFVHTSIEIERTNTGGDDLDSAQSPLCSSYDEANNNRQNRPDSLTVGAVDKIVPVEDIQLFASVGVASFDVSVVSKVEINGDRQKLDYAPNLDVDHTIETVNAIVPNAARGESNIIIRPRLPEGTKQRIVCLDDLDQMKLTKVKDLAFRVVETSPGNHQAWLCIEEANEDTERRLKRGVGADIGANGATRIAGSLNVKEKYRLEFGYYPQVRIIFSSLGKVVAISDVKHLLAPVEPAKPVSSFRREGTVGWTKLPMANYDDYLRNQSRSTSETDFAFCATNLKRGYDRHEIAAELERSSPKVARLSGRSRQRYIEVTLSKAASQ